MNSKADNSLILENHSRGFCILLECPRWFRKINIDVLKRRGLLRQHPVLRGASPQDDSFGGLWTSPVHITMAAVKGEDWEENSNNPVPSKGAPISKVHLTK